MIRPSNTSNINCPTNMPSTIFSIYTEENPQPQELLQIFTFMGLHASSCSIKPIYDETGVSVGKFIVETDTGSLCELQLFKGETSSVDYIVVDAENKPVLLMESTQTTDKDSRNTAWCQRITKFAVCSRMLPGVRRVMYYTDEMGDHTSDTATFALRILATMGVEVCHRGGELKGQVFSTVQDIVDEKNKLAAKCPKHSVPVRLTLVDKVVTISGRLNKTAGRMDNDPNIGLFSGMINAIHTIDPECTFRIIDHQLDVSKIGETNKFWFGVKGIDVQIDGFVGERVPLPTEYFHKVGGGEKMASILFQHQSGLPVAFHNHAGCQRSSFMSSDGTCTSVPKEITMPDIVLVDEATKILFITEGKDISKIKKAEDQLDNLDPFIDICVKAYPGYAMKRGLCLYLDKPAKPTRYPVWFTLSSGGVCTKTLTA